jgi:hypothetical protein
MFWEESDHGSADKQRRPLHADLLGHACGRQFDEADLSWIVTAYAPTFGGLLLDPSVPPDQTGSSTTR